MSCERNLKSGHKRLVTSYLLWLTLGLFGAHHFYLRRDRHAFVWFWTCGGFVIGWICEIWRISDYVRTVNVELQQSVVLVSESSSAAVPCAKWRIKRFVGEIVFSFYLGYLAISALPEEVVIEYVRTSATVAAAAVSVGVHTIANIGNEECSFAICLLSALLHLPIYFLLTTDSVFTSAFKSSLLASIAATFFGRCQRNETRKQHRLFVRIAVLSACSCAMASMFASAVYFNTAIYLENGRRAKVRELVDEYFVSSQYAEFRNETSRLFRVFVDEGFEQFVRELAMFVNPDSEQRAYKVLEVEWNATDADIKDQYQKLVKMYHPDRLVKNSSEERKRAEAKFIEVQKSYERLSGKRNRLKTEL